MDRPLSSDLRSFLLKLAVVVMLGTSAITTAGVAYIGSIQANQYQQVVQRIDANAEVTANGTRAINCVLNISPHDRTPHNTIVGCLEKYGFGPEKP